MRITFPTPPPGNFGDYLGRAFQQLQQALAPAVSANETAPRIILRSSNGTNYAVTVSDAGVLTVNAIATGGP
jgi:hypothetical protein